MIRIPFVVFTNRYREKNGKQTDLWHLKSNTYVLISIFLSRGLGRFPGTIGLWTTDGESAREGHHGPYSSSWN